MADNRNYLEPHIEKIKNRLDEELEEVKLKVKNLVSNSVFCISKDKELSYDKIVTKVQFSAMLYIDSYYKSVVLDSIVEAEDITKINRELCSEETRNKYFNGYIGQLKSMISVKMEDIENSRALLLITDSISSIKREDDRKDLIGLLSSCLRAEDYSDAGTIIGKFLKSKQDELSRMKKE